MSSSNSKVTPPKTSQGAVQSDNFDLSLSGRRGSRLTEGAIKVLLVASSLVAIGVTLGIVLSLVFEAYNFFKLVPLHEFLFGLEWSPQTALRSDQVGAEGRFGAIPLITGTFLISAIAMALATPVGLASAIYLAEYKPLGWILHQNLH